MIRLGIPVIVCALVGTLNGGPNVDANPVKGEPAEFKGQDNATLQLELELLRKRLGRNNEFNFRVFLKNRGKRGVLLNGRAIPFDNGKIYIEPLNSPLIIWIKPVKHDESQNERKNERHVVRLKDVHHLPPEDGDGYRVPLLRTGDIMADQLGENVAITAPDVAGRWSMSCELVMPQPDPENKATFSTISNVVEFEVQ